MATVENPQLGTKYHVIWAYSRGVVGRVVSINEEKRTVRMVSPKTKIKWNCDVSFSDLRHTRKNQSKHRH